MLYICYGGAWVGTHQGSRGTLQWYACWQTPGPMWTSACPLWPTLGHALGHALGHDLPLLGHASTDPSGKVPHILTPWYHMVPHFGPHFSKSKVSNSSISHVTWGVWFREGSNASDDRRQVLPAGRGAAAGMIFGVWKPFGTFSATFSEMFLKVKRAWLTKSFFSCKSSAMSI